MKMEPGSAQWCLVPEQRAQTGIQDVLSKQQEALIYCAPAQHSLWTTSTGCPKELCSLLLGDLQKPPGCGIGHPALDVPA